MRRGSVTWDATFTIKSKDQTVKQEKKNLHLIIN
jgi:hypothetical protein